MKRISILFAFISAMVIASTLQGGFCLAASPRVGDDQSTADVFHYSVNLPTKHETAAAPTPTPAADLTYVITYESEETDPVNNIPIPGRTPAPADPDVHAMKEQPKTAAGNTCVYTESTLRNDLRLTKRILSIPEDGLPIPRLYQFNYSTPVCSVGGQQRSPKSSGCGATVVSMLDAYINGNMDQTPYTVLRRAAIDGYYYGDGFSFENVLELVHQRGIDAEFCTRGEEAMRAVLEDDHPIILHMGCGEFTKAGHYILVRGLNADGNALVNDPNSIEHSQKGYAISQLVRESKSENMIVVTSKPTDVGDRE